MNMIQIWLAFDYIYFNCHAADLPALEHPNGTTNKMNLYINQFIQLDKKNKLCEWVIDPIEKRWWLDDDEFDRWNQK